MKQDTPIINMTPNQVMQAEKTERMKKAINDLKIGRRIYDELKLQGRSATWLAQKLGMERTSLYYVFHRNSVDLELLLRISYFLEHNFFNDVAALFETRNL